MGILPIVTMEEAHRRIEDARLQGSQQLDLTNCVTMEELPPLADLTELRDLSLSNCKALKNVRGLAGLTGLRHLDLSDCNVKEVHVLAGLTGLREINLAGCTSLRDLPRLVDLEHLKKLWLNSCFALTSLNGLAGLTGLRMLDLMHCMSLDDFQILGSLTGLEWLNLGFTNVGLPFEGLPRLKELRYLDLSACDVLYLEPLTSFTGLNELYLGACRNRWPWDLKALTELKELRVLDLSYCEFLDLEPLSRFAALEVLRIVGPLECMPGLCPLTHLGALKQLFVEDIRSAPSELASSSADDNALPRIRAWQQDVESGEAENSTLKLFVLGNGGVGKTQICRRLVGEAYDESVGSTHGIRQFRVRLFDGDADQHEPAVEAHVWDFGGQDIYLGTHALFIDEHAIFVLCWNPAYENTEECALGETVVRNRPLAYWLSYIQSVANWSTPVIVVQTRCDRAGDELPAPAIAMHELRQVKAVACSAKRKNGMKELLAALESASRRQLEWQGKVRLPQSWETLGSSMDQRSEHTLTRGQFDARCTDHVIKAPPEVVLEYLHRSGRVFWRRGLFNDHIVLDQSWALEGVYAILERKKVMPKIRQQAGRFSPELMATMAWGPYSDEERWHFLRLMEECRICFKVDDGSYVAPALLPSRQEVEDDIRTVWRGAQADAILRLDYIFLHEGVLRAMLCGLGERAGWRAAYWAYGACFYDAHYESSVKLASALPDEATGQGGWIRIEVAGGKAAELAEYLKDSILAVNIGRKPEIEWERKPPERLARNVERMDQASKKAPFEALRPAHQPLAKGEPAPVYISYAWDDPTIAWVDELKCTLPNSLRLLRDKNEVRPGGWISTFMQDIGRAHHVVVVLSTKYLQSQYCMRELLYLHDHSLGDRAELMGRIVPVVMDDLKIAAGTERLKQVKYWKDKHDELAKMMDDLGVAAAGGAARDELLAMKDFVHRTDELLSWLNDVLMPRVRKGDGHSTIQAVIEVLRERSL